MADPETTQTSDNAVAFVRWFRVVVLVVVIGFITHMVYQNAVQPDADRPFQLGLDLAGGAHLVYEADTSEVDPAEVPELMSVLRDVIERRVNIFGVSEPLVQVESSSFVTEEPIHRLVVELPGVTDVSEAVAEIGRTPLLEFKLYDEELAAQQETLESLRSLATSSTSSAPVIDNVRVNGELVEDQEPFVATGLTGRYLQSAALEFASAQSGQLSNEPLVSVQFNAEGGQLFGEITRENVGRQLGIFLDEELISAPVINEPIPGGTAIISGGFTPEEARALAQNLNFGALPLPIELQSTQTIGASLGAEVLEKGVEAAVLGLALIVGFMVLWYRLAGVVAAVALFSYISLMLAVFQFVPVTLTAAGLAGFVLSLGIAVDANVLVFERMKEEYRRGAGSRDAAIDGFSRAWSAIRDGNLTSLLSAIILFWFGTSLVKGFALVFGMGIIISMISALLITRTLLIALPNVKRADGTVWSRLLDCGLSK